MMLCNANNLDHRNSIIEYLNVPNSDLEKVNRILDRIKSSAFKRQNPYNLEHPHQHFRYGGLKSIDISLWNM